VGGSTRHGLAAVDPILGHENPWNPDLEQFEAAETIAPYGGDVIVGGQFLHIGGYGVTWLAAIDSSSGLPRSWDVAPSDLPHAVLVHDGVAYVGGQFSSFGPWARHGFAVVDLPNSRGLPIPGNTVTYLSVTPNPARGPVRIDFRTSRIGMAHVRVYDLQGREVAQPFTGLLDVGDHQAQWNPTASSTSGIYFVRITTRGGDFTRRVAFVR
jgi:hypothetical protein